MRMFVCLSPRVWSPAWESDLHKGNDWYRSGNQRWQPARRGHNSQGGQTGVEDNQIHAWLHSLHFHI